MRRYSFLIAMFLALLLVGVVCASTDDEVLMVIDIVVEGNLGNLSSEYLLEYVRDVVPNTMVNRDDIRSAANRLAESGYLKDVSAFIRYTTEGAIVVFQVESNPVIEDIIVEGVNLTSAEAIKELFTLRVPGVLNTYVLSNDLDNVRAWLIDQGYPIGRVTSVYISHENYLHVIVDEGVIEEVVFEGIARLSYEEVSSIVGIQPGEVVTMTDLQNSVRQLLEHSQVRNADLLFEEMDAGGVRLKYLIEEARTGQYEVGVGYNTKEGFLVFGSLSDTNFLRTGRTVGANFRLSPKRQDYLIRYIDPHLCSCWDRFSAELYNRKREEIQDPSNLITETGVSMAIDKAFNEQRTNISVGTTIKAIKNVSKDPVTSRMVLLESSISHKLGNGRFLLQIDGSHPKLYSDFEFMRISSEIIQYVDFGPGVLAAKLRGGTKIAGTLPSVEKFWVGGLGSLRGYSFASYLGDQMLSGTVEYRIPMIDWISLVAFLDFGDAWSAPETLVLKTSWGLGSRIETPVGILQLDLASDVNQKMRFVFGIGVDW